MNTIDIITLSLSGLSLVIAVVGTVWSNQRAKEALDESKRIVSVELWSNLQEAIQRFIGFDPRAEPVGDRLANLRIAMIALVDELQDWPGLGDWLEAERAWGAVLGRQIFESATRGSFENQFQTLEPMMRWAQVLSSNVRRFRREGPNAVVAKKLREHAEVETKRVYEARGWQQPVKSIPGLTTLED